MTPTDPPPQTSPGPPNPGGAPDDPLDALSQRIRSAQEAAERLVDEATQAAQSAGPAGPGTGEAGQVPPRGFAAPEGERQARRAEAQALVAILELARSLVPPELRAQLLELVRELLLLVRTAIDWYLERLESRRRGPVEVEDIPIS
jgi:hypothetical protein